jgi:hypothetical protein
MKEQMMILNCGCVALFAILHSSVLLCLAADYSQGPSCGSYKPAPVLNPLHINPPRNHIPARDMKSKDLWLRRTVSDLLAKPPQRKTSSVLIDGQPSTVPFYTPILPDFPMDYYGESTRGDLVPSREYQEAGLELEPVNVTTDVFSQLGLESLGWTAEPFGPVPAHRAVFCSRTLNFRSIRCIGYDMDYTLVR